MRQVNGRAMGRAAVLVGWCAVLGCAGLQRNPNVVGNYSDKLSPYNYREEGSLVLMVVGVDAGRFIRHEAYVPLFVQVANKSKETLQIGRESFILEDSIGRRYALAPASDVAAHYSRLDMDRRLFQENRSITATYVNLYTYISSEFFPSSSRVSLLLDHVTLPPHAYMEDVLYFPVPESGLNGVPLRLGLTVPQFKDPIEVVFEVPKTLGILEKDEAKESGHRR